MEMTIKTYHILCDSVKNRAFKEIWVKCLYYKREMAQNQCSKFLLERLWQEEQITQSVGRK